HCFLQVRERDQAGAHRQPSTEAGVLHQRGLPGRQVADGAVAEPTAAGCDVYLLRHRELSARALHVVAKPLGTPGALARVDELPAVIEQPAPVDLVSRVDVERELEALLDTVRQIQVLAKLVRLDSERAAGVHDRTGGTPPRGN